MPAARSFDYYVESSFLELYNEDVIDLYIKSRSSLPVGDWALGV
jgi:hypothetical protein